MSQRDAKVSAAAEARAAAEVAEVTGAPAISEHSRRIAAARGEIDVGTRLFVDAAARKQAKAELAEMMPSFATGMPAISERSHSMHREGAISDRLYTEAKERAQRAAARSPEPASAGSPGSKQYGATRRSQLGGTAAGGGSGGGSGGSGGGEEAEGPPQRSLSADRPVMHGSSMGGVRHSTEDLYRQGMGLKKKREQEIARLEREARDAAKPALNP